MNQRPLDPDSPILPPATERLPAEPEGESRAPEAVVFDKAEEAEKIEVLSTRHRSLREQIAQLEGEFKAAETDSERKTLEAQIAKLEAAYEQLGLVIEKAREEHSEA